MVRFCPTDGNDCSSHRPSQNISPREREHTADVSKARDGINRLQTADVSKAGDGINRSHGPPIAVNHAWCHVCGARLVGLDNSTCTASRRPTRPAVAAGAPALTTARQGTACGGVLASTLRSVGTSGIRSSRAAASLELGLGLGFELGLAYVNASGIRTIDGPAGG
jgi:hypothetical protein